MIYKITFIYLVYCVHVLFISLIFSTFVLLNINKTVFFNQIKYALF